MSTQRILILGAGELGLSVINAISSHPAYSPSICQLSVLVRPSTLISSDSAKQALVTHLRTTPISAQFETVDVVTASTQDLAAIFSQYDVIISCNGMGLPQGTQLKLSDAVLLGASKRTTKDNGDGKKLRYFPWQFGMDYDEIGTGSAQDLFDEQIAVRAKLRSQTSNRGDNRPGVSDVDWTIVTNGLFMSFLFRPDFGVVDIPKKTVRALGSWETEITVTTPRDIGRVVAELVLGPPTDGYAKGVREDRNGRIVYIAGDTVTYGQVATEVQRKYGWKNEDMKKEVWNRDVLTGQAKRAEGGEVVMVKYRSTFAEGRGVAWGKDGTFNATKGIDMVDLKEYLANLDGKGEDMEQ